MLLLVLLVNVVSDIMAYPNGAPTTVCESMVPNHGVSPQISASLYRVSVIENSCYTAGSPLNLVISGSNFEGFLVEARPVSGASIYLGSFSTTSAQAQTINCNSQTGSALTHTNNQVKSLVSFTWDTPLNPPDQVIFRLTAVRNYSSFWLNSDTIVNVCKQTITTTTNTTTLALTNTTTPSTTTITITSITTPSTTAHTTTLSKTTSIITNTTTPGTSTRTTTGNTTSSSSSSASTKSSSSNATAHTTSTHLNYTISNYPSMTAKNSSGFVDATLCVFILYALLLYYYV